MGDALARRTDMAVNAYSYPVEFVQQAQVIPLVNSTAPQPVTLTGFRSGEVKSVQIWLQNLDDLNTSASAGSTTGYNPFNWYAPNSVEMVYAGDIYARYDFGVGALFNLINSNKASAFDNLTVSASAGTIGAPASSLSQWLELPFAQTLVDEDAHYILVHGKPITNGIVNLQNIVIPTLATPSTAGWQMVVSYVYNATLLFSQGTADYVF